MSSQYTRFVILLNRPSETITPDSAIRAHVAYLRALDKKGKLVMCGPFADYPGGMVIVKVSGLDEAKEIASADPFVTGGFRMAEVRTWQLSCEENNHMGRG